MRIAYLDCFSGISGDMFLGALLDAGVPSKLFEDTVAALDIGARLEVSRVQRGGISATKVDVYVNGEKDLPREVYLEQNQKAQERGHHHDHEHSHTHSRDHHNHSREHDKSVWSRGSAPPQTEQGPVTAQPVASSHSHSHGRGLTG